MNGCIDEWKYQSRHVLYGDFKSNNWPLSQLVYTIWPQLIILQQRCVKKRLHNWATAYILAVKLCLQWTGGWRGTFIRGHLYFGSSLVLPHKFQECLVFLLFFLMPELNKLKFIATYLLFLIFKGIVLQGFLCFREFSSSVAILRSESNTHCEFFPSVHSSFCPLTVVIQHLAVFLNLSCIQECDGRYGIRLARGAKLNQQVLPYWVQSSMCSEAPCSLMGWTLLWLHCRWTYVHLRAGSVTHWWCSSSWKRPQQ